MKKCNKCGIKKEINCFARDKSRKDNLANKCKQCQIEYNKKYIKDNSEKIKNYSKNYRDKNPNYQKEYDLNHKEERKENWNNYRKNNIKSLTEYDKNYKKNNRKKISSYTKKRYHINPIFKIEHILRIYFTKSVKSNKKLINRNELIGCSFEFLKQHIESQFLPEMNWENHGKIWEIDHIIPISRFDMSLEENQRKAFHYTNCQPLFKTTKVAESFGYNNYIGNREKGNMI